MSTTPWDVYKLILIFLIFLLALIYFYSWQSLTAQGLSLQEMQPWSTTCSQVAPLDSLMVIQQLATFFNFG